MKMVFSRKISPPPGPEMKARYLNNKKRVTEEPVQQNDIGTITSRFFSPKMGVAVLEY